MFYFFRLIDFFVTSVPLIKNKRTYSSHYALFNLSCCLFQIFRDINRSLKIKVALAYVTISTYN